MTGNDSAAEPARYVVVGIDGSPEARRALEWAVKEGQLRHAAVFAVHAWSSAHIPLPEPARSEFAKERAERLLEDEVRKVVVQTGLPPLLIRSAIKGEPVEVLIESARHGSLLVLGSRADHPAAYHRIERQCSARADCPVVIVTPTGAHRLETTTQSTGQRWRTQRTATARERRIRS
ncbi:MAG TPA: universal stress protein [Mycobacteriales bacterium]|nr:universal stress protein [Mycobacteriales bacterium]